MTALNMVNTKRVKIKSCNILAGLSFILFFLFSIQGEAANRSNIDIEKGECVSEMVEFAQITITRLDAGELTSEAFRITSNGMFEWANWSSYGRLIGYSEPLNVGNALYERFVSFTSSQKPRITISDEGTLGRTAFSMEIATFLKSGSTVVFFDEIPDDIAGIIEKLRNSKITTKLQPGLYIWTKPSPHVSKADISFKKTTCESAIEKTLSSATAKGVLIFRTHDNLDEFYFGERLNRIEFTASLEHGNLLFGVLRH